MRKSCHQLELIASHLRSDHSKSVPEEVSRYKELAILEINHSKDLAVQEVNISKNLAKVEVNKHFMEMAKHYHSVFNAHRDTPIMTPLNTPYVVCYEYTKENNTYYKVTRTQLKTDYAQENCMSSIHVKKRPRTERTWEDSAIEIFRTSFANATAFWNWSKIKFPVYFYGIKVDISGNCIYYMSEEEIRKRYKQDIESEDHPEFKKLNFSNEDDAVSKAFTPTSETRNKTIFMLNTMQRELAQEILPESKPITEDLDVTVDEIYTFYKNAMLQHNENTIDLSSLDAETLKKILF